MASIPWSGLLRVREVWGLILSRFLTDPIWWLYITWLPLYLYTARGFSLKKIGMFRVDALPSPLTPAVSAGGWASGFLISRGWTVSRARKTVIVAAALLMCAGIAAPHATDPFAALALIGVVLFGFQAWINNVQTAAERLVPGRSRGFGPRDWAAVGAGIGSMPLHAWSRMGCGPNPLLHADSGNRWIDAAGRDCGAVEVASKGVEMILILAALLLQDSREALGAEGFGSEGPEPVSRDDEREAPTIAARTSGATSPSIHHQRGDRGVA